MPIDRKHFNASKWQLSTKKKIYLLLQVSHPTPVLLSLYPNISSVSILWTNESVFLKMHSQGVLGSTLIAPVFMPPTSKKLRGLIGFGLCVCPSIRNMQSISYEPYILGF